MDLKFNSLNCVYAPPIYSQHILEPVQVHVFFRHGDRSPPPIQNTHMDAELWASRVQERPSQLSDRVDYKNQDFPWGRLTKKGKEQAVGLGQWVRHYYWDVLKISNENLPSSIHFRSTNYERTHMTGWFLLNGLLGSSEAASSIPVEIRGRGNETLGDTGENRRMTAIVKDYMEAATKPVQEPDGTFKPSETSLLFEKVKAGIAGFLGLEPDSAFNWLIMILTVDAVGCGVYHGDRLPESISKEDLDAVKEALGIHLMSAFKDKTYMRLGMGRLMKEIVEATSKHLTSPTEKVPSLYLYSGHDATIMPLSAALSSPVNQWPEYCSNIILELLKSADQSGEYFVRVLYNGAEMPVTLFNSPNHETKTLLTFAEFLGQVSNGIISEEEHESFPQQTVGAIADFYEDLTKQQVVQP